MARFNLPPIPYKTKFLNMLGYLSEPWSKYIVKVDERLKRLITEVIILDVSRDESTNLTIGTGKLVFRMPFDFTISEVRASVSTAPAGSAIIIDINEDNSTILSTRLTIDATEKTSVTAATPAVISGATISEEAEVSIDIDQIGSGTAGRGLKVMLIGSRP